MAGGGAEVFEDAVAAGPDWRLATSCDKFHKHPAHYIFSPPESGPMATESILRPGELKEILLREIEAANLTQTNQNKQSGEIVKADGEKILLPEAIHNVAGIIQKIAQKLSR